MGAFICWLGAPVPLATLVDALATLGTDDQFGLRLASAPTSDPKVRDASPLIGVMTTSGSFVMDFEMAFANNPELVTGLSARLRRPVVDCGNESTSDTKWFIAAVDGELVRHYFESDGDVIDNEGEPLAGELERPGEWWFDDLIERAGGLGVELHSLEADTPVWPIEADGVADEMPAATVAASPGVRPSRTRRARTLIGWAIIAFLVLSAAVAIVHPLR